MASKYVLGIDLGTTNSCVAMIEHGKPIIISNKSGYKTTPSMVAITETGKRLIGQLAKRQAITNAKHTVYSTKRLIGRSFDDPEVQQSIDTFPYEICEGPHNDVRVVMRNHAYALSEVAAMILCELRSVAEEYLGEAIDQAIITVPAYFNDDQRQATIDAGRIAGLDVLRIINEPTAAAIAYGCKQNKKQTIAVYDLGGGTFDISILSIEDGVFNVLSTTGDTFLGGEDFDNRIIESLVMDFARDHGIDLRSDSMAMQRLKIAAEKAKCDLSSSHEIEINLPFISTSKDGETLHINRVMTRDELDRQIVDLVRRTLKICQIALEDANVTVHDIDEVVLVGGMTRMPLIQMAVEEFFHKAPARNINPDEVVAMGAAIQADALVRQDEASHILFDITPLDLGIAVHGGRFHCIIPKNTTVPCSNTTVFTTSSDHQTYLRIVVLQGEKEKACDNQILAQFTFTGIEPAPAGSVDIEITFDIDVDGIVHVTARDLKTHKEHYVKVDRSSNLTQDEIEAMARDNAQYLAIEKLPAAYRNICLSIQSRMQKLTDLSSGAGDVLSSKRAEDLRKKVDACFEQPENTSLLHRLEKEINLAIDHCSLNRP